jgi:phage tail sheath protein FI
MDDLNGITTKSALVTLISDVANSFYTAFGVVPANVPTSTILVDINGSTTTGGKVNDLYLALDALAPGGSSVTTLAAIAGNDNLLYNKIKSEIGQIPVKLPPSSAMAGIYARIDKTKGVWKAPANVSLNYVIKPSVQVSHEEQADMNVDVIAGKSVNAIRAFTGKGVLVWGARTLAGNDNEWRYVPVRRFFNMVEESVKKATDQFVFEGNDANTWVRLRAMIENFLVLQWRAGALTGAKPEQAFFVRIGLGQTMTADDILNGYMNVEIGMAVVRPAEFIVLKFSHKMQEA